MDFIKNLKLRREQRDKAKRQHQFEADYDYAAGILLRHKGHQDPSERITHPLTEYDHGISKACIDFGAMKQCDACHGHGYIHMGNSGQESDGNAPHYAGCEQCCGTGFV